MFVSPAFAQAAGQPGGIAGGIEAFLPLILIFVVFYFLMIRPQQKRMKAHKELLSQLRRGDRVVTSASGAAFPPGIPIGQVASTTDGIIRIEPFVHRHELEFVTVVDFGLGGILPFEKPPAPERRRRALSAARTAARRCRARSPRRRPAAAGRASRGRARGSRRSSTSAR